MLFHLKSFPGFFGELESLSAWRSAGDRTKASRNSWAVLRRSVTCGIATEGAERAIDSHAKLERVRPTVTCSALRRPDIYIFQLSEEVKRDSRSRPGRGASSPAAGERALFTKKDGWRKPRRGDQILRIIGLVDAVSSDVSSASICHDTFHHFK